MHTFSTKPVREISQYKAKFTTTRKVSTMADATLAQVAEFMGYKNGAENPSDSLAQFRKDWATMSDTDKAQLKAGIGDGTLTY